MVIIMARFFNSLSLLTPTLSANPYKKEEIQKMLVKIAYNAHSQ